MMKALIGEDSKAMLPKISISDNFTHIGMHSQLHLEQDISNNCKMKKTYKNIKRSKISISDNFTHIGVHC